MDPFKDFFDGLGGIDWLFNPAYRALPQTIKTLLTNMGKDGIKFVKVAGYAIFLDVPKHISQEHLEKCADIAKGCGYTLKVKRV